MTFDYLDVTERDAIAHVCIDRPAVRNALSQGVHGEIKTCFGALAARPDLLAITLRGRGERSFAAGGDLHEISNLRSAEDGARLGRGACAALDAIRTCPVPVYALLNGDAIGGGAELAMACDVRLGAVGARFGYAQAALNISPAWGGGRDLIRAIGAAAALELMASARLLTMGEAAACGVVQAVAPAGIPFEEFCDQYFADLAARRPQVMRALKSLVLAERQGIDPAAMRTLEQAHLKTTWSHPDHWSAHAAVLARLRANRQGAAE